MELQFYNIAPPCRRKCVKRKPGCHDHCEPFRMYREELEAEKEKLHQRRSFEHSAYMHDVKSKRQHDETRKASIKKKRG